MDRFAYTALSGLRSALQAQDVIAHNIANASTIGFRRDIGTTQARVLEGGFGDRVMAAQAELRSSTTKGETQTTGRAMDVALLGEAMLAVRPKGGGEAYTRRGDLKVDSNGVLTNGDNAPVIGSGGPITLPPAQRVDIAADGTISIQPLGAGPSEMVAIDRIKLVNIQDARIAKGDDGLFYLPQGETAQADEDARIQTGALEGSNVNAMAEMIALLDMSRSYELQVKMMSASKDIDTNSAQLLRLE